MKHIITVFLVFISILISLANRAPLHLEKRLNTTQITQDFYEMYNGVLDGSIDSPYAYRIGVPYLINFLSSISGVSPLNLASILNGVFIFLSLIILFYYSRQYILEPHSYLVVIIFALYIVIVQSMMLGLLVIEIQDILNVIFFIGLLYLIRKESWYLFALFLALSILNRETTILLLFPATYLIWKKKDYFKIIIVNLFGLVTYTLVRVLIDTNNSGWVMLDKISYNIPGLNMENLMIALKSNVYVLLFLFPIFFVSFYRWKSLDEYYKLILITALLFILINYVFGTIIELRLFLPVVAMLLPITILNLSRYKIEKQ